MPPRAATTWGSEVLTIVASKATTTAEAAIPDIARNRSLGDVELGVIEETFNLQNNVWLDTVWGEKVLSPGFIR
jgi:hypothetical protein